MNSLLQGGVVGIALDVEKLSYISSAGIGAIMGFAQQLRRDGGELSLAPTQ